MILFVLGINIFIDTTKMIKRKKISSYSKRYLRKITVEKQKNLLLQIEESDSSDSENTATKSISTSSSSDIDVSPARVISSSPSVETSSNTLSNEIDANVTNNTDDELGNNSDSGISVPDSMDYRFSSSDSEDIIISEPEMDEDYFYDELEEKHKDFVNDIHCLIVEHSVDQVTSKHLLKILNEHTDTDFPKDPRALLKTPRQTQTVKIEDGEYYHFGLRAAIQKMIRDAKSNKTIYVNNVQLLINIDGAPLQNSIEKGIWPIQCSSNLSTKVFLIGLFFGPGKPIDVDQFLRTFVDETKTLVNEGLVYLNEEFTVNITGFICDTPAKSMILNVKGHTGYHSCTMCKIVGQRSKNVTCFPTERNTEVRTDVDFKNDVYFGTYQLGNTILTEIPDIDMVKSFPRDYMHLICLGITRKLLFYGNMAHYIFV